MRRYFDNAATSFPKPPGVIDAVASYLRDNGAPAGRGSYRAALDVERIVARCRSAAARLLGATDSRRVIFTSNGTDSLNLAILGVCRPGDHVVSSTWEHNSVLRPLRWLADHRGVDVTLLDPGPNGRLELTSLRDALRPNTRLVAIQHASNVIGVLQPIAELADIVRQHGAYLLVDAAQSAGHVLLEAAELGIDLLACSGHKGLLGPLGTGVLIVSERVVPDLQPLRFGGTGTVSEDDRQPDSLPEKYESGNHNVPGLVGLDAALAWITQQTIPALRSHEVELTGQLWDGLRALPEVTLYGPDPQIVPRTGVVSLQLAGFAPQDAAAVLDDHSGIATRAGLHCAPGVHRSLGTLPIGGTLRLSLGPFTTADATTEVIDTLRDIAQAR